MREKKSRRKTARREESGTTMQSTSADDVIGAGSSKANSRKLHNKGSPTDVSPDSKCPICLDRFDNISHLDRCLHRFCFKCIKEWAKNKVECPLCKQPFNSILHSVRAEDDFKEYVLRPTLNGSFASPDGQRFRYRTTMTRDSHMPMQTLRSSAHRTFSPPDNGILFEPHTNRPSNQSGSNIQEMMRRLASRRQASAEGRIMRQIQEQELINFRRALYRSGIRVRNIQDGGRYRDISAEFFRRNPACLHRLVPWLKRELTVVFGTHGSLVNIVQHIIMSNVTRFDMESQAFLEDLQPFLLHRTEHFLHEFINFARCPYNIDAYDQHANYDCPAPSYEEGSESVSSVITISPDIREPDEPSSSVEISQAPWDDETPGPSYSTVEQETSNVFTSIDSSDEEPSSSRLDSTNLNNDNTDDNHRQNLPSDDCIIVGFVKPLAERTPELVELSSDSEPSLCEVKIEQTKKPQEKPFPLYGSSESHRSSSSSSRSSDKHSRKTKHRRKTSSEKSHSKKRREKKSTDASSRRFLDSRKDDRHLHNEGTSKWREQSLSSDCYSRSSQNKIHDGHKKWHSKSKHKTKSRERRNKSWRERRQSRSRDRSSSWRSRTVSLSSESSRERNRSISRKGKRSRGRSGSHDSDNIDNYRRTYHWEYTYYSRNRDREEFQKSYKKHSYGRGHGSRFSASPDYHLQTFSQKKESRKQRDCNADKQSYRSRSRSNSHANTAGAQQAQSDKPSGKRKYKTRHLEPQNKSKSNCETAITKGKDNPTQTGLGGSEDKLIDNSLNEPKIKWSKKTRSPSVEIVYEGKCTEVAKRHKKKKKKHKKKHKRDQSSPVVIRIDSDSDSPVRLDVPCGFDVKTQPDKNIIESNLAVISDSPTTSAPINTMKQDCEEATSPFSKPCDLPLVNKYLDNTSDLLDGLLFDESLVGQALIPAPTPQETEAGRSQEILPETSSEQLENMPSTAPLLTASEESTAENSLDTFAETVCEHLVEHLSPTIL
uniref:E3 ubiquitin-protein ligase Topors n=1 Tax=Pyxicephalus adspersus TaxID=30357 RepID=A0AAV3AAB7_PYXAD|nr:TPA: hypothetical protein GDO54_008584 [Pyxicephalus adspersus]